MEPIKQNMWKTLIPLPFKTMGSKAELYVNLLLREISHLLNVPKMFMEILH